MPKQFDTQLNNFPASSDNPMRVIGEYKEAYRIKGKNGEYLAKVSGKHMFEAKNREDYPAIGDWVLASPVDTETAIIRRILPRQTILQKKYSNRLEPQIIATNIDVAFITESTDRDYNLNRLERYVVIAREGKIEPTIILNKIDLISKEELKEKIEQIKSRFNNINVIPTSTVTNEGIKELNQSIVKEKTYCFLGSSGVGKSSLINTLLNKEDIKTREISLSTGKGKHTTTTKDMYFLKNGGIVIDSPGTREVGITESSEGIRNVFEEITIISKKCKFSDCTHTHEPGCAVRQALEEKELDDSRFQNYQKLKKENDYYRMTKQERREKDHKFGKFIKKTQEQLKRIN